MIATLIDGVSVTDAVILIGIAGVALDRLADARGWSRSSKRLRDENTDLLRRNAELEDTVKRHESEIARLKTNVAELEKSSVAAAIAAIEKHEQAAGVRHDRTIGVLTEIRDTLKASA